MEGKKLGIISGGNIIEGSLGPYQSAGVPGAGTDETQTVTIGGTPTSGTFRLGLEGVRTAAITWSAVNATLLTNINAALDARFGAAQIVATDVALTAGIGTLLLTFSGSNYAKNAISLMTVESSLVGTAPTLAIAETTAGVKAAHRGAPKGATSVDTTNGKEYINTGTASAPTWTVKGAQS